MIIVSAISSSLWLSGASQLLVNIEHVVIFLALLSVLVLFHEFGHFVAAKRAGVTVTDFALGFGPSLLAVRRGDTTYRINVLPLGGYCKMAGEDEAQTPSADPGNFQRKSLAARFAIIAAGPIFNVLLAVAIFACIAMFYGVSVGPTNVVQSVQPKSPAALAGLAPGDSIVALDGHPVHSGQDMVGYIHGLPDKLIAVDVIHGGKPRHLMIRTRAVTVAGEKQGQFGFIPQDVVEKKPFLAAIGWGADAVVTTVGAQFVGITSAIVHHDASVLNGPVGIARVVITAESYGVFTVLSLTATISVVLGIFNLLPFPALDGGRLAFLVVELVRGRPVDPEKEGLVHLTGFALLMVLVIFVTYHDIVQWVSGKGGL